MKYLVLGDRDTTWYGFGSYRLDSWSPLEYEDVSNSLEPSPSLLRLSPSLTVAASERLPKCIMLWPPRPNRIILWLWVAEALFGKLSSLSKPAAIEIMRE